MILTVTLNSAVDRVLLIDELLPGGPVDARGEVICVGGKGLDTSVALSGLGQSSAALSFMAGNNGLQLEQLVKAYGITPETVWVEGETSINFVIVEGMNGRISHIKVGRLLVRPEHVAMLLERYIARLNETPYVILAGSIPANTDPLLYAELVRLAGVARVPVLLDSRNTSAALLRSSRPEILKQNRDEFNATFGFETTTMVELQSAAKRAQMEYSLNALVITCGKDGIIAVRPHEGYRVLVPPQAATNAAGAGDAASAGLVWRLSEGDSWAEALRWCGAISAASVLTEATGEVRQSDAERIYPLVEVRVTK